MIDMPENEHLEFVQIASAKDHLYGMTRTGAVWSYDEDRRVWEPLSMAIAPAPKLPLIRRVSGVASS